MNNKNNLKYENDSLFSEHALKRLKDGYMREDETSPQERFRFVADSFGSNKEHSDRIYEYASNLWLSFSTPLLAYGKNKNALPVSCFLLHIEDTKESLLNKSTETRMLSMLGGGVGLNFSIRPRGEKSTGIFPHLKTYDADTIAWKQGSTRRGAIAAYSDINHPEIQEFISVRDPFGGDINRKSLNIHHGINLTDDFMHRVEQLSTRTDLTKEEVEELDKFPLVHDAVSKVDYASVKQLWQSIIETRIATGEPYCHFIDTSNFSLPTFQKELGLKVRQSNLCLTGDSMISIQYHGVEKVYRLDYFCEMFQLGFFDSSVTVKSYNINTNKIEYNYVTAAAKTAEVDELYEIEDVESGKIIQCTADHKIYTRNRGYVMAKDLVEDDELEIVV